MGYNDILGYNKSKVAEVSRIFKKSHEVVWKILKQSLQYHRSNDTMGLLDKKQNFSNYQIWLFYA